MPSTTDVAANAYGRSPQVDFVAANGSKAEYSAAQQVRRNLRQRQPRTRPMQALSQIRQIDYTVILARNMDAMRHFYENIMEFPLLRSLSDRWIEYRVGSTTLALT